MGKRYNEIQPDQQEFILNQKNLTHEQIARLIGKARSHITNMLRILKLPDKIKKYIASV